MFGSLLCCVFVLVCGLFSLEDGKFYAKVSYRFASRAGATSHVGKHWSASVTRGHHDGPYGGGCCY